MVAQSTKEAAELPGSMFDQNVTMWVHEEKNSGRNLIQVCRDCELDDSTWDEY